MCVCVTCEAAGLGQQECAPGHEEEQSRLQQLEISQLSELCYVRSTVKEFNKTLRHGEMNSYQTFIYYS